MVSKPRAVDILTLSDHIWVASVVHSAIGSHLGSDMSAECFTRPQYELRSYLEVGSSLLPGSDADMAKR